MNAKIVPMLTLFVFLSIPLACKGQKNSSPVPSPEPASAGKATESPSPATPAPPTAQPSAVPAAEIDIAQWIEGMQSVLPGIFCKDKSYFRECFKVTVPECEAEAIRVTRVCLQSKKGEIEANLKKDGGKKWGEKVGECAGAAYEISLKDKRTDTPKCNDPSQWM